MEPRRPPPMSALAAVLLALAALSWPLPRSLPAVVTDLSPPAATGSASDTSSGAPVSDGPSQPGAVAPDDGDGSPISPPSGQVQQIRYRVEVRSPDPALTDAAAVIAAVLEDPRGWQQAAIDFVSDPAAPYTIVIAEGSDAQALCQPYDVGGQFSCQNGPLVVLNAIRWREGVPHWPLSLADYRTMLINHEVGHLLGMHHLRCPGDGAVAPVMEQQSGSLRGCTANPWPTAVEVRLAATHQFRLAPPPTDVPFPP